MSLALPSKRVKRAPDAAREAVGRIVRVALTILGGVVVVAGFLIAPLPGPMGLPVVVIGLMLILRNSFKARRQFVRFQHRHPKVAGPIRRLLRRDPEVLKLVWEHTLRLERRVLPRRMRFAAKSRRSFKRRPGLA